MRRSFVESAGWFGSVCGSRRPLPLASRTSAVQPCDRSSSPVSSYIFVFSHPTTGPPPLVHRVLFASSANIRWCVLKQVLMCVSFFVAGSYMASCRPERLTGVSFAEGWLDPCLQNAGLSDGRTTEVIQTRPRSSNIGLCTLLRLVQGASPPQYGDGCSIAAFRAGTLVSRSVSGTRLAVWRTGSSTGR